MARICATIFVVVLTALGGMTRVSAQKAAAERSFSGDRVHLTLSAGTYRLTGSPDGRIRVIPRTKSDQVSVRLSVSTFGGRADVKVAGPKDGFIADIELPSRVAVVVALAAGALHLDAIEGSKEISADSGDIEIAAGDRGQYRRVTASVRTGTVSALGFGDDANGRRSFEWNGPGDYDLTVRVGAGHVALTASN